MPSTSVELDLFGNPIKKYNHPEKKVAAPVARGPEGPGLNAPYDCIKLSKYESVIWNREPVRSADPMFGNACSAVAIDPPCEAPEE